MCVPSPSIWLSTSRMLDLGWWNWAGVILLYIYINYRKYTTLLVKLLMIQLFYIHNGKYMHRNLMLRVIKLLKLWLVTWLILYILNLELFIITLDIINQRDFFSMITKLMSLSMISRIIMQIKWIYEKYETCYCADFLK